MNWINDAIKPLDKIAEKKAFERQHQLTKPLGALGQLEEIAVTLSSMQGMQPKIEKPSICIFAADHGIAATGVSAFPQEVTAQMIANFANGGAAISVLADNLKATFNIVNLGTISETPFNGVNNEVIAASTKNMLEEEAMTVAECETALSVGRKYLQSAKALGCDLFIGGDMGIGNTTSATALAVALTDQSVIELTGSGTGLDKAGVNRKAEIIKKVIAKHAETECSPVELLQRMGGFEIAALVGSYISAAQSGIPILVDGFICTAAALVAVAIAPESRRWMLFAHASAEPGHKHMLTHLQATPILNLDMRLGEGSGAAVCVPVIQLACKLHNDMATFAEAAVAGKIDAS